MAVKRGFRAVDLEAFGIDGVAVAEYLGHEAADTKDSFDSMASSARPGMGTL